MGKTVFLGVEGSGKTTLAMAMLRAVDGRKSAGWYMRPLSRDSFRFVETMPRDFLKEGFPSQTSDLRELRWQLERNGEDFGQLEILDYPGEIYRLAFLDEKDERDKEAFRQKVAASKKDIDALLDAIKNAESIFVLFSLDDAINIRDNPKNLDAVWITYECLNTLKKISPRPKIKLVLTQADKHREAGMDLNSPDLSSIDLILRNHGDVPRQFLSVLDPPESEFGILKVLPKALISELEYCREKFGASLVDAFLISHDNSFLNVLFEKAAETERDRRFKTAMRFFMSIESMLDYAISLHLDIFDEAELHDKKTIVKMFSANPTISNLGYLGEQLKGAALQSRLGEGILLKAKKDYKWGISWELCILALLFVGFLFVVFALVVR